MEGIQSCGFAELVARRGRVQAEAPDQRQRNDQPEEAEKIADDAVRVVAVARHEQQHQRPHQRREQHHRQDVSVVKFHLPASPSSNSVQSACSARFRRGILALDANAAEACATA